MDTNNMIDWNGKLEAFNPNTGEVATVVLEATDSEDYLMTRRVEGIPGGMVTWFREDGSHRDSVWTIRNKPAAAVGAPVDEWGPAIEVGGVRPAWLGKDVVGLFENTPGQWLNPYVLHNLCWGEECNDGKGCPIAIRLPANHPHYRTEKPATGPNGVLTGTERLERLEALTARLAAIEVRSFHGDDLVGMVHEARGLAVDPVEALADKLYAEWLDNCGGTRSAIVAGIKAGRELGK